MRGANHREQALRLRLAVDAPCRVEDLVPAVLGIRLREHRQLDVGRVAPKVRERVDQVIDFVGRERQAEPCIRFLQRAATFARQWNRRQRPGRKVDEQLSRIRDIADDRFGHAIVDERQQRSAVVAGKAAAADVERNAALDPHDGAEPAVTHNVRCLRRPRGNRAEARNDEQADVARAGVVSDVERSVRQQPLERRALDIVKRTRDLDKMPVVRGNRADRVLRPNGLQRRQKFGNSERRKRWASAQRENFGHTKL